MEFKFAPERNWSGSHNIGTFKVAPKRLVEVFGKPPLSSDDGKISGLYLFEGEDGCFVTLYEWKSTNLSDLVLTPPKQFWGCKFPRLFNIGSNDDNNAKAFFEWLRRKLEITDVKCGY